MLTRYLGIGRPFVGYFSDAAGRINMAGTCTFLAGLFCLVIVSTVLQSPKSRTTNLVPPVRLPLKQLALGRRATSVFSLHLYITD
jgi:hypothetical protein